MKRRLVSKTAWVFRGANGAEATVFTDGDERGGDDRWSEVRALPKPKVVLGTELWLEGNERIRLPFEAQASILPDRTGVLVLFEPGEYVSSDGSDVFSKPNNAAIYNSDGSLRFQLKFPEGDHSGRIGGIHSGSMPEKFKGMMGIVAGSAQGMPEWVYAVNPDNPELIPTNQWVRW